MTKLIFTDRNYAGQVYELTREKTAVGRGDQNNLVIRENSLSSIHCEILVNGVEVIVRDLGSRNGTFINGVKLNKQQSQLKSGQTVRFGSVEARLELEERPPEDTASEITAVHALSRALREQAQEQQKLRPSGAPVTMKPVLDSGGDGDHTLILARTLPPEEHAATTAPQASERQPRPISRKAVVLIAAALALGVLAWLWMWKGRP